MLHRTFHAILLYCICTALPAIVALSVVRLSYSLFVVSPVVGCFAFMSLRYLHMFAFAFCCQYFSVCTLCPTSFSSKNAGFHNMYAVYWYTFTKQKSIVYVAAVRRYRVALEWVCACVFRLYLCGIFVFLQLEWISFHIVSSVSKMWIRPSHGNGSKCPWIWIYYQLDGVIVQLCVLSFIE